MVIIQKPAASYCSLNGSIKKLPRATRQKTQGRLFTQFAGIGRHLITCAFVNKPRRSTRHHSSLSGAQICEGCARNEVTSPLSCRSCLLQSQTGEAVSCHDCISYYKTTYKGRVAVRPARCASSINAPVRSESTRRPASGVSQDLIGHYLYAFAHAVTHCHKRTQSAAPQGFGKPLRCGFLCEK